MEQSADRPRVYRFRSSSTNSLPLRVPSTALRMTQVNIGRPSFAFATAVGSPNPESVVRHQRQRNPGPLLPYPGGVEGRQEFLNVHAGGPARPGNRHTAGDRPAEQRVGQGPEAERQENV